MAGVDIQTPRHAEDLPCRIFVSYAHRDEQESGLPGRFHLELCNLLSLLRPAGFCIQDSQVFFDKTRLGQAESWTQAIAKALEECELFVLLVSSYTRASGYCIPYELRAAVRRGVKVTTVLLHPTDGWIDAPVFPDQAEPRRLGEFHSGGLPKGPGHNVLAISEWTNPHAAWAKVMQELREFTQAHLPLQRPVASGAKSPGPATASSISPAAGRIARELLPYFCDQQPLATEYEQGLGLWKRSAQAWALLVLFKGRHDDGLDKLAQRMRLKYLREYFPGLPPPTPLHWPEPAGLKPEQQVACAVAELLETLGLERSLVMTDGLAAAARALSMHLSGRPHATHLCASLPQSNLREAGAGVLGFLRFLDAVAPLGAPVPSRLVIDLIIEPEAHELALRLVSKWKLTGLQAVQVIEVSAPRSLGNADLTNWHTRHVQPHFGLEREDLLKLFERYFDVAAATPLRLKTFARVVGPLLT